MNNDRNNGEVNVYNDTQYENAKNSLHYMLTKILQYKFKSI